ncbi:MAG: hypothetical protein D6714_19710 [Bacteroidetes bacterium]|nr:MAG: hypothetical protein D6714_19710 [Bacteroidota bacterium]
MSVLKKLESIFFTEEEETSPKSAPKAGAKGPEKATTPPPAASDAAPLQPGKADEKFMRVLLQALEKNNIEGFDYFEFKQSLQKLEKMPMDEATRFKSAFALASTMGATPEKLIQTAEHYLTVLKQEEQKFGQALANQRTSQIETRVAKMKDLDRVIQQKAEQIKKLTQEIEKHQAQKQTLEKEIAGATAKVEQTKINFTTTLNQLMTKIKADVAAMKKYLK